MPDAPRPASDPGDAGVPAELIAQLCLRCGLCCNGVLFRDVELQRLDQSAAFRAAGLTLVRRRGTTVLPQPCAALGPDLKCRVYASRPNRCRDFECALLKDVASGKLDLPSALKTVSLARQRAAKVVSLLRLAGDSNDDQPLTRRFQQVQRRCEAGQLPDAAVDAFGELTLAVHSLNVILSTRFYPGR